MASCIFCKIVAKEMSARLVHEDATSIAFHDINPQAPVHVLLIPKKHFASAQEAEEADEVVLGHLHRVASRLAGELKITDGYRTVVNTGAGAGQSVFHFHLHLLGGRTFRWPAG
jgi:histidine triad (HIT) family protein